MMPHVLVTRPAGQAPELCARLRERGLQPIPVPTVAIDRISTAPVIDEMLERLDGADWLVITSANGAEALADRLAATDRPLPASLRVAAVGPATAGALGRAHVRVDHVPDEYLTVAIADGLGDVRGRRVVLARADAATPELREALEAAGALVEEVVAYRTIEGPAESRDALHVALHREIGGITFTSSSTVRGLLRLASPTDRQRARAIPAFCIGPVTAATARRSGFDVGVVAEDHTATGLADAIASHLNGGDR
ncbi:MAG TPA: uroporphyrinogen-III synthase [Candidatus Limnocylindrales bacterium]|jgi:uroporphyrinogen-III synthase|nr:uroporphyrinogen-III synthase [Candidatus Limnocylindrales bacterium]